MEDLGFSRLEKKKMEDWNKKAEELLARLKRRKEERKRNPFINQIDEGRLSLRREWDKEDFVQWRRTNAGVWTIEEPYRHMRPVTKVEACARIEKTRSTQAVSLESPYLTALEKALLEDLYS